MALAVLFVGIALTTLVSTLAGALVLRSLGVGVPRVDFGVWSPRARFSVAGSEVSFSPWLISGSSTFKDIDNVDIYADSPGKLLSSFGRIVRSFLHLVGPFAVLAVSILFAGQEVLVAFVGGFTQVVEGALHPLTHAQSYLSTFVSLATNSPLPCIGIVLAKLAAFSLLPLPHLAGGQALFELIPAPADRGAVADFARGAGNFAVFFIVFMWLFAAGWRLVHDGMI